VRYYLSPRKKNLNVIFASCYNRFNTVFTKLHIFAVRYTARNFGALKCHSRLTNLRVRHVVATACGNYALRLWSGIQWYKVYVSISQCVCVCVCVCGWGGYIYVLCIIGGKTFISLLGHSGPAVFHASQCGHCHAMCSLFLHFVTEGRIKCRTAFPVLLLCWPLISPVSLHMHAFSSSV
jgi:hypothetical protein